MATVRELTDVDFQDTVDKSATPVLVDFSATWCQPCKALAPIIDAIAKEYQGKILVTKVDIDKARQTAIRFGIQGVPTCIFFKSGAEVDRFMGLRDVKDVRALVDKVLT
jgi:thioredoxin 1